jgi:uncharacterized membrane protein YtjA (UPF0391 family)
MEPRSRVKVIGRGTKVNSPPTYPGESAMLRLAIIFLIVSLVAGAFGFINVSDIARRISIVLFALFFIGFLILLGFALLVVDAASAPALAMISE